MVVCNYSNSTTPPLSMVLSHRRQPTQHSLSCSLSQTFKPLTLKRVKQDPMINQVLQPVKRFFAGFMGVLVDSIFNFAEQPMILQGNFAPVQEIEAALTTESIEGEIPENFPEGVYMRNGPNPKFPDKTSTSSIFGKSTSLWFEGHGMLHATYFNKDKKIGKWGVLYRNKYAKSTTLDAEIEANGAFLPAVEGHSSSVIAGLILNWLRFGKFNRDLNNTSLIQHAGKVYSVSENHMPYELDTSNLETLDVWDFGDKWDRPFTSHPKRAPRTGQLVTMGVDGKKPYYILGIISENGKKMVHKVDLKFERSTLAHEIGVTENYNIIMDYPLIVDVNRLIRGGSLIRYEGDKEARFGVMPRYGDIESIQWFYVEAHCTFHVINCYEEGEEVIVVGCRSNGSIIPGPDHGINKQQWFRRAFRPASFSDDHLGIFDPSVDGVLFPRPYEWRLNTKTGEIREKYIVGEDWAMDFPTINESFVGLKNKYAYAQVLDSLSSSERGMSVYSKLAKLYLQEDESDQPYGENQKRIKVEYHPLGEHQFCSGLCFVQRPGSTDEDDGWLICYVHDESTNLSHVCIVDAKRFTEKPVAKVSLPQRVPYGFHGTYVYKSNQELPWMKS